jgi:hypothetical protein
MDTQPAFGLQELFAHLIGGIAKAVGERQGESRQQQFDRTQAAAHTVMAFMPRDAIEAMISGHCVMFHEMMVDSVRETLRGEAAQAHCAARRGIVAMDRAFGNNLARLERYRRREADGCLDVPDAVAARAVGETDIADRVSRHRAANSPGSKGQRASARQPHIPEAAAVSTDGGTAGTTCCSTGLADGSEEPDVGAVAASGSSSPSLAAPQPPETAANRKHPLIMRRGFQNRRARRAKQKPGAAPSRFATSAEQPRKAPLAAAPV